MGRSSPDGIQSWSIRAKVQVSEPIPFIFWLRDTYNPLAKEAMFRVFIRPGNVKVQRPEAVLDPNTGGFVFRSLPPLPEKRGAIPVDAKTIMDGAPPEKLIRDAMGNLVSPFTVWDGPNLKRVYGVGTTENAVRASYRKAIQEPDNYYAVTK